MTTLTLTLNCSEALAQQEGYPGDSLVRKIELDVTDGPWVQFTYGALRTQAGDWFGGRYEDEHFVTDDGRKWSDLIVSAKDS